MYVNKCFLMKRTKEVQIMFNMYNIINENVHYRKEYNKTYHN